MTLPGPIAGLMRPDSGVAMDRFGRIHSYLRLSITDRCNFRCTYCMPEQGLTWMEREKLLTFEEIIRVVSVMASMGVERVRLTGGEPLLRKDVVTLVKMLSQVDGVRDLSMTTNGALLPKMAEELAAAGLNRVNISLDSLDAEQFERMTRGGKLPRVLAGIHAAREAGLTPIKINAVMVAGENEGQLDRLVEHFSSHASDTHVRFIEAMPFGAATSRRHLSADRMREWLAVKYTLEPVAEPQGGGPATMWKIAETGLHVGFISPITGHFCQACNRLRLMADGQLRTCLSKDPGPGLKSLVRSGATDEELERAIRNQVWNKVAGHEAHRLKEWKPFEGVMTQIGG